MYDKFLQISTSMSDKRFAQRLALRLVENALVACVQIVGPIESIYRWKGRVERAKEWLCLIKAKSSSYKKIESEIKRLHPYEVPEIIAVPITSGSKEYLKWLAAEGQQNEGFRRS
jgi:periplasmic divalent cation tolerance protein